MPKQLVDIFKLPTCPSAIKESILQSPSTFILFSIVFLVSLAFGVWVLFQYNTVRLPLSKERIRTKKIRNHMWALYYICVAVIAVISTVKYAKPVNVQVDNRYLFGMNVTLMILHSFSTFFLTLALDYQRIWRSGNDAELPNDEDSYTPIPNNAHVADSVNKKEVSNSLVEEDDNENENVPSEDTTFDSNSLREKGFTLNPFAGKTVSESLEMIRKTGLRVFFSLQFLTILVLVFVLIAIIFEASNPGDVSGVYIWTLFVFFIAQRLPIVLITCMILFSKRKSPEGLAVGPTLFSRTVLAIALILNLPNGIPLAYWYFFFRNTVLATKCIFYIASIFDVVIILYLFSLVFWLLFIRSEYIRNQEAAMFTAMQQTQNIFDVVFE
jgi:hypothetical protein